MKRIDTPTALAGGHFSNANPDAGGAPTQLDASWFESVQEEVANVVEGSGQALNAGDKKQLLKGIQTMISRAGIAVPAGATIACRGASVPEGYVQEDGRLLYIDKCPGLYAAIGNIYNNGVVPINTFRVPDSRGRTTIGAGTGSGLAAYSVGDVGGEEEHALSVAELPVFSPGERPLKNVDTDRGTGGSSQWSIDNIQNMPDIGGGESHNNMQPYMAALSCIKLGIFDDPVEVV